MVLITKENWSGSSNTCNFIVFSILSCGSGEVGTGEDGSEGGEGGGGVGGGCMHRILCIIKWIALCGETFSSFSSSPHRGKIKGLFSNPLVHFCRLFCFA